MRTKFMSALLAAVAVAALVATGGSASAATLKEHAAEAFIAIYGNPGVNGATSPVGGGQGRNFGFGANLLFQAGGGVGEALALVLPGPIEEKAGESFIGGTLMSNKTGANNPLSFGIEFVDFQEGTLAGYSDTWDRPWISEICSPGSATCRTDPLFATPGGSIKIEDVTIALGKPGAGEMTVVQGTVWGIWENSPKAGEPPCIKLSEKPPAGAGANQNLIVTQVSTALEGAGIKVGTAVEKFKGRACLTSANNYWDGANKPLIEIENT